MVKDREKVFADLGNATVRAQEWSIVLTFTHRTRKAKEKEKVKTVVEKEKVRRKPRAKVKEKKRKAVTKPAKEAVPAKTIGTMEPGQRTH